MHSEKERVGKAYYLLFYLKLPPESENLFNFSSGAAAAAAAAAATTAAATSDAGIP